jgi:uncharacterized RmlC-like cupin family protein
MSASASRSVHVTKASELKTSTGQTQGMIRQGAIVELSSALCGSLMIAKPRSASDVHHHGEQDTVVYAVSGTGGYIESEGGEKKQKLDPGDWALIPAFAEHREVNDGDEDVTWVIVRAPGGSPVVQNLEGWGKSQPQ